MVFASRRAYDYDVAAMVYFACAIFLSAFLLFQTQPLIGKYILPWFGGTPAVWSTALLFFQAMLTGGYAYANWLHRRLSPRAQGWVHGGVVIFSLALLGLTALRWSAPILPDATWRPGSVDSPFADVFTILTVAIAVPYFVLASNSPLLQAWFSRAYPDKSPYRLYALSNAGSLLALLTYPILVEPNLTLTRQGWLWTFGYAVFAALVLFGAYRTSRLPPEQHVASADTNSEQVAMPGRGTRVMWLLLPACASALLLATTSQITQEVAVIPFLWVLPLAIYLVSFILTFDSDRWYSRRVFTYAFFIVSALVTLALAMGPRLGLFAQLGIYLTMLFVGCMICHGELVRLKPHPRYLTTFYLMLSIGGALGGIAVSLLAPLLFKGYWELPLALIGCAVLLMVVTFGARQRAGMARTRADLTILAGALVLLCGVFILDVKPTLWDAAYAARNFYGVLRVNERDAADPSRRAFQLAHGATLHGFQFTQADKRALPTAYFTEQSGIGLTLRHFGTRRAPLRIGVLGLGIGVLAAYAQPGDEMTFYEINPDVIRLAEGEQNYFHFLPEARGAVRVVPGDARLSLEQELAARGSNQFDLVVLDTFNSDSVPVHLVTREALALYLKHLKPDGVLALHISNNYLDLRPVIYKLADEFGLQAAFIETPADNDRTYLSLWMLLTRNKKFLEQPAIASRISPRPPNLKALQLWTDDYSNLFQILR